MNKALLPWIMGLLLVAGCKDEPEVVRPQFEVVPLHMNYGTVEQGELVKVQSTLVNTGEIPFTVRDIQSSCACTYGQARQSYLRPGEQTVLDFTFNTTNNPGAKTQYLTLRLSDDIVSGRVLTLDGEVRAPLIIEPYFHRVTGGQERSSGVPLLSIVRNNWTEPITMTGMSTSGDNVDAEVRDRDGFPLVLQPGEEIKIDIMVRPHAEGPISGTVTVQTEGLRKNSHNIVIKQDTHERMRYERSVEKVNELKAKLGPGAVAPDAAKETPEANAE
ncbi:MAG: DUF1573 domain-containing protein [Deltaproteobacteria bacterium]|nr:DUF1573 domain-containing protein [bacterium]MCB9477194.1 DUF1573 domain-containing protein [Deltaproteobacteria bacterium]MCB9479060.1 DUF1573 domain-containing protein [Deltaproteobacteria bacterium]MCB9488122.1 DUF1573 domain-containing protein [Deltaproteobacteria bacterium]